MSAWWKTFRYLPDKTMVTYGYPYHGEPLNIKGGAQRWAVWHQIIEWQHKWVVAKWQHERDANTSDGSVTS